MSLFLLLAQGVIKALIMNWRAGGVCFQIAGILCQDGGCVSGTITDTQNLETYVGQRRQRTDSWKESSLIHEYICLSGFGGFFFVLVFGLVFGFFFYLKCIK